MFWRKVAPDGLKTLHYVSSQQAQPCAKPNNEKIVQCHIYVAFFNSTYDLDARLRGHDGELGTLVIPAKLVLDSDRGAGIQVPYPELLRTYLCSTEETE